MRRCLAALAGLALPALAVAAPPDGVYVSDAALCPAVEAGDYGQVSATDGLALAPSAGVLGADFRCNFSPAPDDPEAVTAKCLGQDGLFDDVARFTAGDGTLDVMSQSGRIETDDGGTRLVACAGAPPEDFPLWDGIER